MKKTLVVLAIAGLVLIVMTASVFAWSTVTGCAVDKNGDPWTHGGTATYVDSGGGGTQSVDLDANGCFSIDIGFTLTDSTVTIVFDPGTEGTPLDATCAVPAGDFGGATYECGDMPTETGPNAVTWTVVSASTSSGFPLEMAAYGLLALIFVGGGVALWRQQRLSS